MGSGEGTDDPVDWVNSLEAQYTAKGKRPPGDNWLTFLEIQKTMGCGVCKARRILSKAKQDGEIEVFHGSLISQTTGTLCRQIWSRSKS